MKVLQYLFLAKILRQLFAVLNRSAHYFQYCNSQKVHFDSVTMETICNIRETYKEVTKYK